MNIPIYEENFVFFFISAFACLPLSQLLLLLWFLVSYGWFSAIALCDLCSWGCNRRERKIVEKK